MSDRSAFTFDVVRSYDPAIWSGLNEPAVLGKYVEERDMSLLQIDDSNRPVIFKCRVLSRDQRDRVDEQTAVDAKRKLAFRFGVLEVRDIEHDGMRTVFPCSRANPRDGLAPPVLDALEDLGFGHVDMLDIGAAIMARSFLARGVSPRCALPDTSRHACAQMLSRLVELRTARLAQTVESGASAKTSDDLSAPAEPRP